MNRRRRLLGALTALVLLLAACGIPEDDAPRALAPVLPTPVAPTPTPEPANVTDFTVYLIDTASNRLVPVVREVPDPVVPSALIAELIETPTDEEAEASFSTFVPETTTLAGVSDPDDGLLVLNFVPEGGFADILDAQLNAALAQVVYTLTGAEGIDRIQINIDGAATQWPTDAGAQTVLTRTDFATLDPDFVEPTPTAEPDGG